MEEKILAISVRKIQNSKEKFPFYSVLSLASWRPGTFLVLSWLNPVVLELSSAPGRWKWGLQKG